MRRAPWSGILLLALLPGCVLRTVWQRTHRVETQWVAATRLAVRAAADGSEASAIVMEWPKPADWQRGPSTVEPPAGGVIGLPTDLVAVEVMPQQWPATAVALLVKAWPRSTAAGMDAFAELTIDQDFDVELAFHVSSEDEASLAEVSAMPGVAMERFCYICGAARPWLRDRARLGPATAAPADGIPASLEVVRRTPIGVTEKVLVTPFAAAADLVLLPFELLSIRVWW
jgi:hypothetical protein